MAAYFVAFLGEVVFEAGAVAVVAEFEVFEEALVVLVGFFWELFPGLAGVCVVCHWFLCSFFSVVLVLVLGVL